MKKNYELEHYLQESNPDKRARAEAWATAIGLQAVDGLQTSQYLKEIALKNIEGEIDIDYSRKLVKEYYERKDLRDEDRKKHEEADKVASNISKILTEKALVFSPAGLISIHRRIFEGVFSYAGEIRNYNIIKKEWVLDGETVIYAPASEIIPSLEYDFSQEKMFNYKGLDIDSVINHISKFISGIWQIHPFREGNTRTCAVFLVKYLRSLGYDIDNKPFEENSWYFRNALVRSNVKNAAKGIEQTFTFLKLFFENLLKGDNHELKNRHQHIHYQKDSQDLQTNRPTKRPSDQVIKLIKLLRDNVLSVSEMMKQLGLKHIPTFRKNYLLPALNEKSIERTIPDNPTDPRQKYRLTDKGISILNNLSCSAT